MGFVEGLEELGLGLERAVGVMEVSAPVKVWTLVFGTSSSPPEIYSNGRNDCLKRLVWVEKRKEKQKRFDQNAPPLVYKRKREAKVKFTVRRGRMRVESLHSTMASEFGTLHRPPSSSIFGTKKPNVITAMPPAISSEFLLPLNLVYNPLYAIT